MRCSDCEVPLFLQTREKNPLCQSCKLERPFLNHSADRIYVADDWQKELRNKMARGLLSITGSDHSQSGTTAYKRPAGEEKIDENKSKHPRLLFSSEIIQLNSPQFLQSTPKPKPLVIDLAMDDDEDDVSTAHESNPSANKLDETFTSLKPTEVTKPIAVKKEYVQEENDQNKVKEVVETTTQDVNNIAQTNAVPLGFGGISFARLTEKSSVRLHKTIDCYRDTSLLGSPSLNVSLVCPKKEMNPPISLRETAEFLSFENSDHLSLEALRSREKELSQKMVGISSDSAVKEIAVVLREKINELKMKRLAHQENIDKKESNLKVLESKRDRLQLVVTACKKERDGVGLYLTDAEARVERARNCLRVLDEQVVVAQQELNSIGSPDLVHLLLAGLKNKEKRAASAKAEVERSVASLKETQDDLTKAENELEVNENAYQVTIQKLEKEKTELNFLKETRELNPENDAVLYDCQLKEFSLPAIEKVKDLYELEGQFIHMQYLRRKQELSLKKKTVAQFLPTS